MATKVGELYAVMTLDDQDFEKGMEKTGGKTEGWASKIGGAMATAGVAAAAALGAVAVASTKMAIDFQASMANVQTLLGPGMEPRIQQLGDDVKRLSVETGKPLADMADGVYQVISAWGDTAETSKLLEISAKASAAGLSTTTEAVNMLSSITKGYGDTSAATVQKVADLAFQTANLGQTTFPELAASMGKVVPLAATAGVKMEELFGAMATLTGVTGNTAEVSTQLRATIQSLLAPSDAMSAALEKAGYSSGQAAIKQDGLAGVLQKLQSQTGGNTAELAKMFGSVEALNAVLALTGAQSEDFKTKTDAMTKAAGASTTAFDIQQKSVKAMWDKLKAGADVMMVTLGEQFLPILQTMLQWVMAHMPEIQSFFDTAFSAIRAILSATGDAFNWFLLNIWQPLTEAWTTGNTDMDSKFGSTMASIGVTLQKFWEILQSVFGMIQAFWAKWGDDIMALTSSLFETIGTVIDNALKIILGVFQVFHGLFTGNWSEMKEGLLNIWNGFWNAVTAINEWASNLMAKAMEMLWEGVKAIFKSMIKILAGIGKDIMQGFLDGLTGMFNRIWQKVTDFVKSVRDKVESVLGISSPSKVFADIGENVGLGFIKGIEGTRKAIMNATQDVFPGTQVVGAGTTPAGPSAGAQGAGGAMVIHLSMEGRTLARAVMPYIPGELMRLGVR